MDRDFQRLVEGLIKAAENIDCYYFRIPVAEGEAKYRERVYCYELYHQLRCVLGDIFPYKLQGEVDKSGHPAIRRPKNPISSSTSLEIWNTTSR